ncbi:uncharacterized membrane protein YhaH (DUF805 family) [Rhodoligotrophos appendicifer]|uniref:DUF805 domain-containing protein n=1 Tax=Rhodoligotrophos appendicifer TaxID=987056 RepID=UPI001186B73C|nr:DUF805 domain-containing protein [Rhodoligotrophos appendicifer]
MLGAILYNLANLAHFRDRETRAQFWPYAIFVSILAFIVSGIVMSTALDGSFDRFQRFAAENPELATIHSGPAGTSINIKGYHPELMPDLNLILSTFGISVLALVGLLAAAVTRRLRDSGRSGFWGCLPLPFLAAAFVLVPNLLPPDDFNLTVFISLFINNIFYLGALAVLVSFLARPSSASSVSREV